MQLVENHGRIGMSFTLGLGRFPLHPTSQQHSPVPLVVLDDHCSLASVGVQGNVVILTLCFLKIKLGTVKVGRITQILLK